MSVSMRPDMAPDEADTIDPLSHTAVATPRSAVSTSTE
jgi:hypothetical protein